MASTSVSKTESVGSSPTAPAKVQYLVVVSFIDNSYWDDGHRGTTRRYGFKDVEEFKSFYSNLVKTQKLKTRCRAGGEREFDIYLEDIEVYRITEQKLLHKEVIKEFWNETEQTRGEES